MMTNSKFLPTTLCMTLLGTLGACDSGGVLSSGGSAGDTDDYDAAIALLAPYEGIYDLQEGWSGVTGDQAYLFIGAPDDTAVADAALYDYDEFDNCLPASPTTGEVTRDPFTNQVFMDGIFQFDAAILTLTGTVLSIEFNDDSDIDGDGSITDRVTITGTLTGVAQVSDLGAQC